jgi:flagellar biosynthesis protein FlhA
METGFPSLTLFVSKRPGVLAEFTKSVRRFLRWVGGITEALSNQDVAKQYAIDSSAYAALETELRRLQESFFNELGVIIPPIRLREDENLLDNTYRLQMNDRVLDTIVGLEPDEFWLSFPARQVVGTMWWGRTWQARNSPEPNTGDEASVVRGDETSRRLWEENNYQTKSPPEYIALIIVAALRKHAADLLVPDLVQHYMTKLRIRYPMLIDAISQRFDTESLTSMLRAKLERGTSIKDLPRVLENILVESVVQ